MNSAVATTVRPEEHLGLHPLALVKAELRTRIESSSLTWNEKQLALREADFLIRQEHLRRVRSALWQWQDERRERVERLLLHRHDLALRMALERARARAELTEIRARIVNARLDVFERVRRLAPRDDSRALVVSARKQLLHQQLASRLSRNSRRQIHAELADMIAQRGRFQRRVREEFPDLEDELMDKFDEQVFQRGVR